MMLVLLPSKSRTLANNAASEFMCSEVMLGYGIGAESIKLRDYFQRMGCTVRTAHEATEADKESVKLSDGFVVLQWEQGGLLSAAKLRLTRPKVRVVLLGCRTPKQIQEAMFVGAIPMADASELHDSAWILKL